MLKFANYGKFNMVQMYNSNVETDTFTIHIPI